MVKVLREFNEAELFKSIDIIVSSDDDKKTAKALFKKLLSGTNYG